MTDGSYLTGAARLAGVMGWPIEHSRSPRLHGYWLERYSIDGAYLPLAVAPERLEAAIRGLHALGFQGCNLTIPHKEAVLPLVDEISERARRIGAINTIVIDEDGRVRGDNTDGFGFTASLEAGAPTWRAVDGPVVLLGAGGAARAIAVALLDAGAPLLRLVNRTVERAERLAEALRPMAPGRPIEVIAWRQRGEALADAHLLVNTTSLGMAGQPRLDIALDDLPTAALVTDIVYSPLETELLAAARARANPVVDGLGMLLHQGRPGFAAWFGIDPEVTDASRVAVLRD
ncbi:MAG: shikimate dehydrogenase [Alphaproteobacteria bacterium]|nr:shikimate dehydrogenase [Alphaproteobacteria bacterium]